MTGVPVASPEEAAAARYYEAGLRGGALDIHAASAAAAYAPRDTAVHEGSISNITYLEGAAAPGAGGAKRVRKPKPARAARARAAAAASRSPADPQIARAYGGSSPRGTGKPPRASF